MGGTTGTVTLAITPMFETAATRFAKLEHEVYNRFSRTGSRKHLTFRSNKNKSYS